MAPRAFRALGTALLAFGVMSLGCTGGAETAITGFGNGGNFIGTSGVLERAARELAMLEAIPEVSDEDLRGVFGAIRARALDGNPDAVLVLARVAALQRPAD